MDNRRDEQDEQVNFFPRIAPAPGSKCLSLSRSHTRMKRNDFPVGVTKDSPPPPKPPTQTVHYCNYPRGQGRSEPRDRKWHARQHKFSQRIRGVDDDNKPVFMWAVVLKLQDFRYLGEGNHWKHQETQLSKHHLIGKQYC